MPSYSFCLLGAAGITYDYLVKTCRTDQDARERAAGLLNGSAGVEIWRDRQLIGRLMAASADQTNKWPAPPATAAATASP